MSLTMEGSKNEEVEALEVLRDKSAELVRYLDDINAKLMQMNQQNEMSLRVLENWSSVIAISKVSAASTAPNASGQTQQAAKELTSGVVVETLDDRFWTVQLAIDQAALKAVGYKTIMRTNGFEKPFSRDQVTSWIIQLILIGSFIAFVATLLSWDKLPGRRVFVTLTPNYQCLAILLPNATLVIIVITSWCICESRDPSKPTPSSIFPSLLRVPHKEARYCGLCYKNSPGLDHHCTWLNTCIGESNYESFYWLVVSATCQTLLQTVIGILMCTLWEAEVKANSADGWSMTVIGLLWIHNAACMSLSNSFVLLAGFHTYLLCVGMGTYDFILANGSDGLCTRMLKCNCLRRGKARNRKRSHVQHDDTSDTKGAKGAGTRTRRGSPPAAIVPASLSVPSSFRSNTSLEHAAATAAMESNRTSGTNRELNISSFNSTPPPDMVLSVGINESEGIFENDLGSPVKTKKTSSAAITPVMTES
ncbi:putative protein S-acyltransferase 22 [Phytophthora citrophthora]|uniref:Palmitoyltransferase n=1 Tax=Phytophthora citrophthora TaxID=4793 RepID=A0AAD9GRL8_9STRA|nr:putative protein S-acyltransferase 22 [Phytophthora citrophthora]